jgi:hypothetical protein
MDAQPNSLVFTQLVIGAENCLELRIFPEKRFQPIVNNIVLSMKFKASITVTTRRRKKTALVQMTFQ